MCLDTYDAQFVAWICPDNSDVALVVWIFLWRGHVNEMFTLEGLMPGYVRCKDNYAAKDFGRYLLCEA